MILSDFDYNLPSELIAKWPVDIRSDCRLMRIDKYSGDITHHYFCDLHNLLNNNDLLVLNDTKVISARIYAYKSTGGKVEILVEKILTNHKILAQTNASKSLKFGDRLFLKNDIWFDVLNKIDDFFELSLNKMYSVETILNEFGQIPLPPYIKRTVDIKDQEYYQTIFAKNKGSVASPTAGLHFDKKLFYHLNKNKINVAYITLHIGSGTFKPVRTQNIENHKIHNEYVDVSITTCEKIIKAKKHKNKVIAIGTTVIRALETASFRSNTNEISAYHGNTDLFLYPGCTFNIVDALITNFHLPKSSLLMLVSAFAGHKNIMRAYEEAIKEKYRFYSYGDAMIII